MRVALTRRAVFAVIFGVLIFSLLYNKLFKQAATFPIRIGILHSLTGTMAHSEKPLVDILLMGVDEINGNGGLLGRKIEAVVVDGQSDAAYSAREAERLIRDEKVDVIFGCWTSICRKAVKSVIEKYSSLLFYPVQYEGLEQSLNIIYTGATLNQQIIPGASWALAHLGKRVYLIGSDYVFPKTANYIIRDILKAKNSDADVVAERYRPLGSDDFDEIIGELITLRPDVILNTINGDSNRHFFLKKHQAGLDNIPVVSFCVAEAELVSMPEARLKSHYAVWNYFQTVDSPENNEFVSRVKKRFGNDYVVDDPMEASYVGLYLWAQAVQRADSTNPELIGNTINEQVIKAPEGIVSVDSVNHHLRKRVRIGQAREDGLFDIVWESEYAIRPVPYPSYHARHEWDKIIEQNKFGEKR